jgi:hypothetical protein
MSTFQNIPDEVVNHIFKFCQGRTNQIMKEHIYSIDRYKDPYYPDETHLINILRLMEYYGHIYFEKERFHSRFYRCLNCNRVGYAPPYIEYGETFCSYVCSDMFDY